jgi:putative ABC transport system substrate-binding protein
LLSIEVRHPTEFDGAFTRITRLKRDALIVTDDPLHQLHIERIVDYATRSRLPTTSNIKANVKAGELMSYAADYPELYRRAAIYVGKILNGTKPGDLPIEQPTQFEFIINGKTAKAFRLTIPPSVLARADQVIE